MKEWAIIISYSDGDVSVEYFIGSFTEAKIAATDALRCAAGESVTVAEVFGTADSDGKWM